MSVKQGLMALLAHEPMYGARLRAEFEARTGGTWPLNVGQVYTTLARLERDGFVEALAGPDDEGRIAYSLTDAGRAEIARWWLTPVARESTPRDELVIKLALAVTLPGIDVAKVVQTQRTATLRHLRDLTRLKSRSDQPTDGRDLAWSLVLENHLFAAEAEARWLDHVEARLARAAGMPLGPVVVLDGADEATGPVENAATGGTAKDRGASDESKARTTGARLTGGRA